jgi:hypothetical protein
VAPFYQQSIPHDACQPAILCHTWGSIEAHSRVPVPSLNPARQEVPDNAPSTSIVLQNSDCMMGMDSRNALDLSHGLFLNDLLEIWSEEGPGWPPQASPGLQQLGLQGPAFGSPLTQSPLLFHLLVCQALTSRHLAVGLFRASQKLLGSSRLDRSVSSSSQPGEASRVAGQTFSHVRVDPT